MTFSFAEISSFYSKVGSPGGATALLVEALSRWALPPGSNHLAINSSVAYLLHTTLIYSGIFQFWVIGETLRKQTKTRFYERSSAGKGRVKREES